MKLADALKEIERYSWWSEECPGRLQYLMEPMKCFITQGKRYPSLPITIVIFKDNFYYEETPEQEKYAQFCAVIKLMEKDPQFLEKQQHKTVNLGKDLTKLFENFEKKKKGMDNQQVFKAYVEFFELYDSFLAYPVFIECADIFTSYYLWPEMRKELKDISDEDLKEGIYNLTVPKHLSFMEEEHKKILETCLAYYNILKKGSIPKEANAAAEQLAKEFFFLSNTYKDTRSLDGSYFIKKMQEEVEQHTKEQIHKELMSLNVKVAELNRRKNDFLKKNNLSKGMLLKLSMVEQMGSHTDQRKQHMLRFTSYIGAFVKEIAYKAHIDFNEAMEYTLDELKGLLIEKKRIPEAILKERRQGHAIIMRDKGRGDITTDSFYGKDAVKILDKILFARLGKEIKGHVASAPVKKIQGTVQIVHDTQETIFKKGNILVATMTRPDFLPMMRKAKAVITDEGGLTCHAAIISREMQMPCIIGTKNATKILKDGDEVEMDLVVGTVKKV